MAEENYNANQLNQYNKIEGENLHSGGGLVGKPERDEAGRFVSGHSKIGGMRKGYISPHRAMSDRLQAIQEITIGDRKEQKAGVEILTEVLFKMAVGGNLGAIKEFFDRVEGKPKQLGVNDEPDEINLTAVFQQIFQEHEEKKRRQAEGNDLENK